MKEYKWSETYKKVFKDGRNSGGFPSHCPECKEPLVPNDDYNYASDWWASYTCTGCSARIKYMPTDMGQTLPQLIKYK